MTKIRKSTISKSLWRKLADAREGISPTYRAELWRRNVKEAGSRVDELEGWRDAAPLHRRYTSLGLASTNTIVEQLSISGPRSFVRLLHARETVQRK